MILSECFEPRALGMEHGQIADMQIKGSSIYSDEYEASYGRLNAVLENSRACWCPSDGDSDAWLQVDFILGTTVTSVYTQGNPANDVDERVTTFQISYSMDGVNFVYYKEDGFVKVTEFLTFGRATKMHTISVLWYFCGVWYYVVYSIL
jgi:hypothetical protein